MVLARIIFGSDFWIVCHWLNLANGTELVMLAVFNPLTDTLNR